MDKEFSLNLLETEVSSCQKCNLHKTRTQTVFGCGNINADLMIIGESPGQQEDEQGKPFVGRARELLNKWLKYIELTRDMVYITNIVKCRPPGNRNPFPEEMLSCDSYLKEQIQLVSPKVILLLGAVALKHMLDDPHASITRRRGEWLRIKDVDIMPTFHPAFLLRQMSQNNKENIKSDLKAVKMKLDQINSERVNCGIRN